MSDGIGGTDWTTTANANDEIDRVNHSQNALVFERVMAWHAQLPRAVQLRLLPDDLEKLIAMLKGQNT